MQTRPRCGDNEFSVACLFGGQCQKAAGAGASLPALVGKWLGSTSRRLGGCYKIQRLESIQERGNGGLMTAEHEATQLAIR